ncbi:sensor histidine kinase [Variovorax sp. RHLX14]|uniref:sensor histidine kinase n=1 Tax=Variovorax sp. RHLX14 TaxID=1259731 RepID=UPI003F46F621
MLDKNVQSLRVMLDDITGLTKLQAGKEFRRLETVEISEQLNELCAGLTAFADERGLALTYQGCQQLVVMADTTKIRRIAQNLILNALKYTESGGVDVSWHRMEMPQDLRWVLQVQDSGPGMDPDTRSPLANALIAATKVDQTTVMPSPVQIANVHVLKNQDSHVPRMNAGEGLGLSIVKRLADLLDATIELRTEIGGGSTFKIYLPTSYARPEVEI